MKMPPGSSWIFVGWASGVILIGSVLTSYHQPFQTPDENVLTLAKSTGRREWRAIHLLSGSCRCSQKVMLHLLERRAFAGVSEQIILIDGQEPYLPGSAGLLARLNQKGFPITHILDTNVPWGSRVSGVPLLIFASPDNHVAYVGGYGAASDQDIEILREIRSGTTPKPRLVLGCAVGGRLRRSVDPFHLKY